MNQSQTTTAKDIMVQANEMPWHPFGPGTWVKVVYISPETGMWACLLKLDPGSQFTRHFHKAAIDFYVIKGEVEYRAGVVREGGYAYEPLGVLHEATNTKIETVVFAHFFGPVEFLDDDDNVTLILDWKFVQENLVGEQSLGAETVDMSVSQG
ncbi:2,4'-dihydroxyacetophenone dioxygenase family protein [Dactylosporangium sp. NPDC051484]|uniref:2,4'-dihydroxyacetophenone dioxygenase family protein n=1 Tax=Dactylosporangium sp. NPDC051484 TaxID=3154942 RepID=UPI00344F6BF3